jgi:hypothetical protein
MDGPDETVDRELASSEAVAGGTGDAAPDTPPTDDGETVEIDSRQPAEADDRSAPARMRVQWVGSKGSAVGMKSEGFRAGYRRGWDLGG